MKIKRFNHINENSNINWEAKFQKHYDLKVKVRNDLEDMYDDARPLLTKYLEIVGSYGDISELENVDIDDIYVDSFEYYPGNPYMKFMIKYTIQKDDSFSLDLNDKEFDDLLEFLRDPELYINANKYNL